jgi:hypothetical protein
MATMEMAQTENTTDSKRVRRMFGLDLDAWNTVMVSFLGVAAAAAVVVGVSTAIIIKLQKQSELESNERIASLVVQGDELRKETADANARTKESELALAELSSPRKIDPVPFKKALEGVTPIKVEILYAESCSDCFWLASWIFNFLGPQGGLGWPVSEPKPLVPVISGPFAALPPAMSAHANTWGVTVVAGGDPSVWDDGTPQRAIAMALARSMGRRPLVNGNFDVALPKDSVRIVVAPKT